MAAFVPLVMVALPRLHRGLPASLIAVVAATTVIVQAFHLSVATYRRSCRRDFPLPCCRRRRRRGAQRTLIGAAIAIAALSAIESLLSARVVGHHVADRPVRPRPELFGQGLASVASGAFGGMPATGAIARTAVNVRSGARNPRLGIVHSLVLLAGSYLAHRARGARFRWPRWPAC